MVTLADQAVLLRRQRAVELREPPEAGDGGLEQERQQRDPVPVGPGRGIEFLPVGVQGGDVCLVVVRDMRDVQPGSVQVRSGQLLDPRQRPGLDGAELREVLRRDLRDSRHGHCRRRRGGLAAQVREQVVPGDPALGAGAGDRGQVDAQFPRGPAHARPGMRPGEAGPRCRSLRRVRRRGRRCGRGYPGLLLPGLRHRLGLRHRPGDGTVAGADGQDQRAGAERVTDLDPDAAHLAGERGRQLHRGLFGFQRDQRVFLADAIAGPHVDLDDLHVLEGPGVGDSDLSRRCHGTPLRRRAGWPGRSRRSRAAPAGWGAACSSARSPGRHAAAR